MLRNPDRLSGALVAILAIGLAYSASQLSFGDVTRPGTGFFPAVLAGLLFCLSAVLLFRAHFLGGGDPPRFGPASMRVALAVLALSLYGALLEWVGYPILTFALLFAGVWGLGRISWKRCLVVSLTATTLIFVLFRGIGIPLPSGLLPV